MKTTLIKLTLCLFITTVLISCSKDDVEIYEESFIETKVSYSPIENEILNIINEFRRTNGIKTLEKLNIISSVAETHSSYMVKVGEANHDNFPERHEKLVHNANAKTVGENVAYGFNSAESVVNALLNSEHHKKIIVNPDYTHFGISTKTDNEGRNYFTHIYIKQ